MRFYDYMVEMIFIWIGGMYMTSQERFEKVKDILENNDLGVSILYVNQFDKLSESELLIDDKVNEVVAKIKEYEVAADKDKNKYPERIMRDVRKNLGLDEMDTSHDDKIMAMAKKDVFNRYCEWNGLCGGYGYTLLNVVEDIYEINLQQ